MYSVPIPRTCCIVLLLLVAAACEKAPTRWDEVQDVSRGKPAVSKASQAGSAFNRFFPKVEAPFDLVYKQEKTGFVEASLKRDGKEVAVLTISDTANNPEAAEKYKESLEKLGEYPLAPVGGQGTGLLVADRYQVQVRSMDESFAEEDRREWLEKFALAELSQLQ
jgi:hypothetical protein